MPAVIFQNVMESAAVVPCFRCFLALRCSGIGQCPAPPHGHDRTCFGFLAIRPLPYGQTYLADPTFVFLRSRCVSGAICFL